MTAKAAQSSKHPIREGSGFGETFGSRHSRGAARVIERFAPRCIGEGQRKRTQCRCVHHNLGLPCFEGLALDPLQRADVALAREQGKPSALELAFGSLVITCPH